MFSLNFHHGKHIYLCGVLKRFSLEDPVPPIETGENKVNNFLVSLLLFDTFAVANPQLEFK